MSTETDLRELLVQLEDGAPTVSSVLDALAVDARTTDRPTPATRHRRGWRVAGAAATCAAVVLGVGALNQVAHRRQTAARPPTPAQPSSLSSPRAANEARGLSAPDRALALVAAHQAANQLAVGHNRRPVSGWPDGISAVTAVAQSGTVTLTDSNTGHSCASGTIILVRLVGAFDVATTGNARSRAGFDTTVREIDLTVDATTGLTCLSSARTKPVPPGRAGGVLYRR